MPCGQPFQPSPKTISVFAHVKNSVKLPAAVLQRKFAVRHYVLVEGRVMDSPSINMKNH